MILETKQLLILSKFQWKNLCNNILKHSLRTHHRNQRHTSIPHTTMTKEKISKTIKKVRWNDTPTIKYLPKDDKNTKKHIQKITPLSMFSPEDVEIINKILERRQKKVMRVFTK